MSNNTNSDVVSKEWNGFGFKLIEKTDYSAVLTHLEQNFLQDEPLHQATGLTTDRLADISEKITDILELGHGSFYAYPMEEPTQIAAVMIIWIHEKGKDLPPRELRSPLSVIIRNAIIELKEKYNIHEQRNVDTFPELFIISTDKDFRGKGLATEMYKKAILKLKANGYKIVSSTFTNPLSRKIGDKLGFKEVSRLYSNDSKNEDGSSALGEAANDHFVTETVLDLE
ncbi:unnamed protein product [Orchesella dallaii]|uniref:N-acetyltransferase domain-containing protein n=1 Tax=Orchesella dallaii TaxID=48710 RepID=A0ABP1PV08_9HEXA